MIQLPTYEVQDKLIPQNLEDISQDQVEDHWSLYKGYVTQVNTLNKELSQLMEEGKGDSLHYADRRRRYGFEYNGMVLHEYYFGNLKAGVYEPKKGAFYNTIERFFGSYQSWKTHFENAGKTRGIGWAILYADTTTGALANHFIGEHQNGNVAGFAPVLVLDVWEHAYMVDHRSGGRAKYIAAFMKNINWEKVEERYSDVMAGKISKRF